MTPELTRRWFATIGMIALSCSLHPGEADARRAHASIGMSMDTLDGDYGDFHIVGQEEGFALTRTGNASTAGRWMIPLLFDTTGAKTIVVTGRDNLGRGFLCQAVALNRLGTVVSSSNAGVFTPSPSFGTVTLNLPAAPAGSLAFVWCGMYGNNEVLLLGVDYNQ